VFKLDSWFEIMLESCALKKPVTEGLVALPSLRYMVSVNAHRRTGHLLSLWQISTGMYRELSSDRPQAATSTTIGSYSILIYSD